MSNFYSNTTNCSSPYDRKEYAYVAIASAASAFVSLLASCFVIFIIILFKKWRFFSQRLVLYLAIAAVITSISNILHRVDYENQTSDFYQRFCIFGGFLEQMSSWIFFNAISSITIYLLANIVLQKDTERLEPIYIFFIFIFPFTFNWIPFLHSSYGRSGAWCWIRSEDRQACQEFDFGRWLIFFLWFIPLYTILFVLISLYLVILCSLRRANRQWTKTPPTNEDEKKVKKDLIPLMAYPIIYFLLSIPPFINRIHSLAAPGNPVLALWYLSAVLFPFQGGLIAIAYSLDKKTRKRLKWVEIVSAFKECTKRETGMEYPAEYVFDKSLSRPIPPSSQQKTVEEI